MRKEIIAAMVTLYWYYKGVIKEIEDCPLCEAIYSLYNYLQCTKCPWYEYYGDKCHVIFNGVDGHRQRREEKWSKMRCSELCEWIINEFQKEDLVVIKKCTFSDYVDDTDLYEIAIG